MTQEVGNGPHLSYGLHFLPVSTSGRKQLVAKVRRMPAGAGQELTVATRRQAKQRIAFGGADDFPPEKARSIAEGFRARCKLGEDPQAEKVQERQVATVKEIAGLFLEP
jgi:hypothetical protein